MKKTKLLMPLAAVASLTAVIPALTLTSCNKNTPTVTKPTQEEWTKAFEVLTKRADGICWHTTQDSYVKYGDGASYEEAEYGIKYTSIECGQQYNKMKCDYKVGSYGTDAYTYYATTNNGTPNITVTLDKDNVLTGSYASTNVDFDNIFEWINVYAISYTDFKYNEQTKIFEYTQTNDITKANSKIKFNDSKQIEYIESIAQDSDNGYIGLNLHFTYDKTEIVLPASVNKSMTNGKVNMTTQTTTISEDIRTEDGIDRGIVLTIKPTAVFTTLTATYPSSDTTHIPVFANSTTEIYKNGNKLQKDIDYKLSVPYSTKITFLKEDVKPTDVIIIAFNLTSSTYRGGSQELISLKLQNI